MNFTMTSHCFILSIVYFHYEGWKYRIAVIDE